MFKLLWKLEATAGNTFCRHDAAVSTWVIGYWTRPFLLFLLFLLFLHTTCYLMLLASARLEVKRFCGTVHFTLSLRMEPLWLTCRLCSTPSNFHFSIAATDLASHRWSHDRCVDERSALSVSHAPSHIWNCSGPAVPELKWGRGDVCYVNLEKL